MHILFIDDDAEFANARSEMLEEQNIQVDQAECGGSGHELADIYDYQAIVPNLGAGNYLTKPLHSKELVARLEALVRRANGQRKNVLEFGDLTLDLHAR